MRLYRHQKPRESVKICLKMKICIMEDTEYSERQKY